jgi:hypothetical protein
MRLRMVVTVGMVLLLGSAGLASAAGHASVGAAPPPPPPPRSAPAAGFGHNAAPYGPAAAGFGHNAAPYAAAAHPPMGSSSSTSYQGYGRGPAPLPGKWNVTNWLCLGSSGYYYSSPVPCVDAQQVPFGQPVEGGKAAQYAFRQGPYSVSLDGYAPGYGAQSARGANWSTEPWAVGLGLPQHPGSTSLPIFTNLSRVVAPYSIVLRSGTALASMEAPKQSGGLIVGRDRTGRMFSIKASEVDVSATRLPPATTARR